MGIVVYNVAWAEAYLPTSGILTQPTENWGGGLCALFFGGAGSPSNTMSPGPRSTSAPSGILIHPAVWPEQTWAKNGDCSLWGRWDHIKHIVAGAEAYLHAKFHLDPDNRLATVHQRYRQTDRQTDKT